MGWHLVDELAKVPEGELKPYSIATQQVVIFRRGEDIRCFGDFCTHQDVKLSDFGEVDGGELVCWAHGARFALENGAPLCFPAEEALKRFPIKVENGKIFIELED